MLAARLVQVSLAPVMKSTIPILRSTITVKPLNLSKATLFRCQIVRNFADDTRQGLSRAARRKTLREQAMAPAGETAFNIGKGALAGGAVVGLGALCFYGLGLSSESGAIDHAM